MKINAIVEMPAGTSLKFEMDKTDGILFVDRIINCPVPYHYGFIPNTLSEDGDPIDVFIITKEGIPPLTRVPIEIVDVIRCKDKGLEDDKLIAVIEGDSIGNYYEAVENYLLSYKHGIEVVDPFPGKDKAIEVYKESLTQFDRMNKNDSGLQIRETDSDKV